MDVNCGPRREKDMDVQAHSCQTTELPCAGSKLLPRWQSGGAGVREFDHRDLEHGYDHLLTRFQGFDAAIFSDHGYMVALLTSEEVVIKKQHSDRTATWEGVGTFSVEIVGFEAASKNSHGVPIQVLAFSPGNEIVAWITAGERTFHLWDLKTRTERARFKACFQFSIIQFSRNADFVAFTEDEGGDFKTTVLDTASGKPIETIAGRGQQFAFSTNESVFVTWGKAPFNITIWELPSMKPRAQISGPAVVDGRGWYIEDIALSTAGAFAVAMAKKGHSWQIRRRIEVRDTLSGRMISSLDTDGPVNNLRFSPDNQYLVSTRGRIPLPPDNEHPLPPERASAAHTSLYVGHNWIVQGEAKLLWLPPLYRDAPAAVEGSTIFLTARELDAPVCLEIDLSKTPLVKQGH